MTAFRRLVTLPLLVLALVAVLLVPVPPPADAQTETTVLVSNTGQSSGLSVTLSSSTSKRAQQFTTGSNEAGYTLGSIGINFTNIANTVFVGGQLTVTLNANSSGNPGAALCTLSNPGTFSGSGVQTFVVPATCPTLAASTAYFVVAERSGFVNTVELGAASTGNEDAGGAMGWSIGNARHSYTNGSWGGFPQPHQIEIKGSAFVPPPPKRVTGFDLDSNNGSSFGMWGNDDTFWVVNDGGAINNKLYAYNRSDGSRDSANDFDNVPGAGNLSPTGICSDGTTMFVADHDDDKLYAYKMSDTSRDSTKDITLDSANTEPRGMWCDETTVYVANDGATSANKVFAYTISSGAHDSSKDFEQLYVSTNTAAQNAETPRGIWSNGTTMFVADSDDDNVFAYKHSDESQDSAKNLALTSANDNPKGMWFDGRVLWVVDETDDAIYPYDLPDAQPDNTPAVGDPAITSAFTQEVFTATVTSAALFIPSPGLAGYAVTGVFTVPVGSISESQFTVEGVTYTVRAVVDGASNSNSGDLIVELNKELPRSFTFTADGVTYSSHDATESEPGTGRYRYQWAANLSWGGNPIPVVLTIASPKDGVEVSANVSGITDSTDGVASAHFEYQWIRVDGADEADIDGATGSTYTPTADDVDKHLKVRVVFDDDAGYREYPRTSPQFGPVVGLPPEITSVAITSDPGADKTYAIGDDIVVTFTFDKNITLTDASPLTPYASLYLGIGFADEKEPGCVLGTAPTKVLACTHTVDEDDEDTDGILVSGNDVQHFNRIVGPFGQIVDASHSGLAADSDHKVDGVRPELNGARPSADKSKITLTFSEAIGSVDRTKITFDSGGTTLTTTAHSTSGSEVEITLTTALTATDTNVTVALAADAVADAVGNGNAVLAATPIVDETAPTLSETSTPSNTEVLLTYNEPLDPDSIPETSAFTVGTNEILSATLTVQDTGSGFLGCNDNPSPPFGDECNISSTLTAVAFSYGGTDYEVEIIELKAGELDFQANRYLEPVTVRDLTLKVGATSFAFADATQQGSGLRWTNTGLTWSQGDTIALSIGGGTAHTVSTAALSGTSGIALTLSPAFRPGDALTVSYTVPETNPIQDIAGNDAAALADQAVSNTLDATAPEAVAFLSAAINTSTTFGEADLLWDGDTWANGSPITRHEVRYGDQTPIWSATLTVKQFGTNNLLGCETVRANFGCEPGELLTDNTFSYDSVDYRIDELYLTTGGQLFLATNKSSITAAALADLTLHVGGLSFPFADATPNLGNLTWTGTGLSWSEDDTVALAIRRVTSWTEVPDSAPGEANETSHTLEGLDPGGEYTFEVRAVNDVGGGGEASDTLTLLAPVWSFTLRDGGGDVTGLTEGGTSAAARVTITNAGQATFGADQTITLEWGGRTLVGGRIQGAGNTSTITILAGASTGHLDLSAPDNDANPIYIPETGDLTATWEDDVIGTIMDLRRIEDESAPVARITDAPESVNEGDTFDIDIELSVRYPNPGALRFTITDDDSALSGTLPDQASLVANELTATVTLTAAENTTQNDGARTVTFALETSTDIPYTLGTPKTVTIIVRDDDTPPLAVGNLRAQAGNTEATLRWDAPPAPTPDHGQPITHYEYRVKAGTGSFSSWATLPGSDGTTTSHKFTGLTNETEYTYELRAENVAGDGAEAQVMVTPIIGVAVSFGSASASITEGGSATVTLTLATAPAAGTTVTVPITATRGTGLGATEYSGVPASVTFAAGDTSKSFTVTAANDTLDEPDEELTLELGTLPDGYVAGTNSEVAITVVDDDVALLGLTLRDSGHNAVTQLVEGGASATATVWITNNVRFETDQTVTLEWGGQEITSGLIQGAGGSATITITAGQSNGTLAVSSPQRPGDLYRPPETETLTATHGGAQIGGGIELAYVDDEDPPVFTISLRDTRVVENSSVFLDGTLSRGYDISGLAPLYALAMGATPRLPILALNAQDGQPAAPLNFEGGQTTSLSSTMTPTGNSAAGDHATVTFTIPSNPDYYTIGTPSMATLLILDDDAAPGAPRNITARPGDTGATLRWDHPATYDQIWVSDYQYRQRAGTGPWTSWAAIGGSDGETTSHPFTGLTNEIEYTFEIRARNSNHNGAVAQVQVTPREGVAVSFGAGSASITEGGSVTVTVTLDEAPAAGTTVTAPITATRGAGLSATEYSGVPASVVFNAGQTSKSFTVTTVDNTDDEPHRTLTLGLGTLPEGYVAGTHHEFVLTLLDDDVPVVSATFDPASASVPEGAQVSVTVRLSQAPEREVALTLSAARGANLDADEFSGVPPSVTFAADATEAAFTVTFGDDTAVEGNETLTLGFSTPLPGRVTTGANPQLVLTVTDDDGPAQAPGSLAVITGHGYAELSWELVVNDSPVLRYEVRWRETDGGTFNAWQSVGPETSYRVEGLTNGAAHTFEVQAVNAHGSANVASVAGTPTERVTGVPTAPQVLQVEATDSGRAELSWARPANASNYDYNTPAQQHLVLRNSALRGYSIEVCRTACDDEANWYEMASTRGIFSTRYVHQVLAPGVIRENRYRVRAININGVPGPWSNVATLDATEVEGLRAVAPDSGTLRVWFQLRNPDGNPIYVRYRPNDNSGSTTYGDPLRPTAKGEVRFELTDNVQASTFYRVDLDWVNTFDSGRGQSYWLWTPRAGETPLKSPYARDLVEAQVWQNGAWRDASTTALTIRMGEVGKYRVGLKPCTRIYNVIPRRIESPAGRLRASPAQTAPTLFSNLRCEKEGIGYRTDENGNYLTMSDVYDMTNFPDRANDRIPIYGGSPNDWYEVTVTARALEDYAADVRPDALLSAPFAVVYNHEVSYGSDDTRSGPVSDGSGLVRILVDRPADATLPVPGGVTVGSDRHISWNPVPGAWGYLVEWRHGPRYGNRANQNRSLQAATSVTLPPGASGRGPVTARVRAYSGSGVSGWSAEQTWDSRTPTLNVFDAVVNEADGSVGFLVTLDPAATGTVTVQYTTVDATAVAPADYTTTSGTVTFAPGETSKQTALVPITDDGEEDSGETFRLVLSNPTGSDANNGAAVIGDGSAVATILNSEQEVAWLTGFTLVDAGTNADLMALADGSTVQLGELAAASYGIRADISPGAQPGSVRFALSGAKTVTSSDDAAPYSLYGDGAGRVNGQALPAGSYTLRATAYADSAGQGDERGSLEVSFTVTAGTTSVATPDASDTGTGETASGSTPVGADDGGGAAGGGAAGGGSGGGGGGDFDVGVATFVVANGWSAADVGVASVLAARTDGAVVVYTAGGELSSETRALLREALPAEVVIVGGNSAVSRDVRNQIRAASPDSGISRESGVDRADTAAATARRILGAPAAAGRVTLIVANGWSPPDIGAAAALAARSGRAAVLYTEAATLSEASAALLRDYEVARVILVGGTAAIGPDVADAIADAADGASISRLTGDDRIDTAAQAARRVLGNPAAASDGVTLVIANGWSAPDVGVAAALAAATDNAAVAYTTQGMLPEATAALIRDYRPTRVIIVGGRTAVAEDVRTTVTQTAPDSADIRRITGQTRTDTAARAARRILANL
ncbi:Calx-beta domain-containing protein [Candidatus Poriferisodalis sp.]|uniref:Calx-beta domain-containing protein n=1 Tax=Candidatus Poriferisodalis sp. TaxID=3101277 RepID=UPI003B51D8E3